MRASGLRAVSQVAPTRDEHLRVSVALLLSQLHRLRRRVREGVDPPFGELEDLFQSVDFVDRQIGADESAATMFERCPVDECRQPAVTIVAEGRRLCCDHADQVSEVLGFLVLALCALGVVSKVATEIREATIQRRVLRVERLAYEEFRATHPVDRPAIVIQLVGTLQPRFAKQLPANPVVMADNSRLVSSVAAAESWPPCDEITSYPFFTARDFGDETSTAY
jgi:hypothetical protein